jgi:ribosomal protein S18 acetylase RimI-like enzyme
MRSNIRQFQTHDLEAVLELSLAAWEPVFISFEQVLGTQIFARQFPDWRKSQREGVAAVLQDNVKYHVFVAEVDGRIVGFIAYELNFKERIGETTMLAVDPAYQNVGIGTQLNDFVLASLKEAGMTLAVVATGGDPGHAPARRAYEKAGYTALPLMRYYKAL